MLPRRIVDAYLLQRREGVYSVGNNGVLSESLVGDNDDGKDFAYIADVIERGLASALRRNNNGTSD